MPSAMTIKYVVASKKGLLYQRRYPTKLRSHPQVKTALYSKSMGVKIDATNEEKLAAWNHHNRVFEDYCKTLSLTNSSALEAHEQLRLAKSVLASKGLKPGMLADNPLLSKEQNHQVNNAAYMKVLESGVLDPLHEREDPNSPRHQEELNALESIAESAWKILTEPKDSLASSHLLLSECWDLYSSHKDIDSTTRVGKRQLTRWLGFLAIAGDGIVTQESIHEALDRYVAARSGKIKGSSLAREVAGILACVRHCIRLKRLPIVVSKPVIKDATKYESRHVFTLAEHQKLFSLLSTLEPWKEAVLLVMIQTGCITTELQRCESKNLILEGDLPYIKITGKVKTASRERYVPLVLGIDRLRELKEILNDGSGFAFGSNFSSKGDSNISHQLNTVVRKVSTEATVYSLRHTVKANALARGVDTHLLALIGGWSGLVSSVMLGYGSSAYGSSETLRRLQEAMRTINSHLIS